MDVTSSLSWALLIVGVFNFALAIMILIARPRQMFHIWAALLSAACGVWSWGIAAFLSFNTLGVDPQIVARTYYIAAATIGFSLLELALSYPVKQRSMNLTILRFGLFAGVVALSASSGLVRGVEIDQSGNHIALLGGWEYGAYVLYFVCYSMLAIWILVKNYFEAVRLQKRRLQAQLGLIVSGSLIALFFGMIFNLVFPLLGDYSLIWVGPPFTLIFVATILYSIVRYSLFEVKLVIVRATAYILSLAVLVGVYLLIASLVFESSDRFDLVSLVMALTVAFLFQPVKIFFDKVSHELFFKDRYNSEEFYVRLNEVLSRATTLDEMLRGANNQIAQTLQAKYVLFHVRYSHNKRVTVASSHHRVLPEDDIGQLDRYVNEHGDDIIVAEKFPTNSSMYRMLTSHRVGLVLPLMKDHMVFGYMILGEGKERSYGDRDLRVLKTISDELVIAIQNALSVQEVRDINENLEQRIEAATAELRSSNARLTRLDAAKDEFLSMASHQLRTPLTSIKGYLSMVLEGDVGKVSENQKKVLEEAYSSSERMVHLIHDFLNVSRLQTGKFMLEVAQTDIVKLVRQELKSLESSASSHDLTFEFVTKLKKEEIKIDDTKIRQVVMNYIDNAIFYSRPGTSIVVELAKRKGEILFSVKDTGIGVPKAEQDKLFEKFYRATNARRQRPDGTGVGLYLAKTVITAHGGEVIFSSTEGKGSTFGFKLPIKNDAILEKYSQQLKQ